MTKHLEFYKFSVEINKEISLEMISYAGVFGVKCNVSKRIFILGTENLLLGMGRFFKNVENGLIKNQKLVDDITLYGQTNFSFFVFEAHYELENSSKREEFVNYYKNIYKEKLYD